MTVLALVRWALAWALWPAQLFLVKPMMWISTTRFRWVVIVPIVLPMSFVYYLFTSLRSRLFFALNSGPKNHARKVQAVVDSIKANVKSATPKRMCTARPSWENMSIFHGQYKKHMHQIDLSQFIDILEIDEVHETVRVEPLVNVGQLTAALVPRGWTVAVLPELDDLTVGGLINGFGIESSSHRYGLFQHVCVSLEVVLADGTLVHCSPSKNAELFYALPWAQGSLGFLVAAELRLVRAKPFIRLDYEPYTDRKSFLRSLDEALTSDKFEFIEALAYSAQEYVLMKGNFADKPGRDGVVFDHGKWHAPWFYRHVEGTCLHPRKARTEYVPLRAYYHRHTRSLFWEMEDVVSFGNNPLFRLIFGWLLPPKVGFLKLTTNAELHEVYVQKHVDQDVLVPIATLSDCLDVVDQEFAMYPLWLCPCRILKTPVRGLINPDSADGSDMYVDVGVYGVPKTARPEHGETFQPTTSLRRFERFVRDVKGYQALYAITYQTREELESMFDLETYNKMREAYCCDGLLPRLYDKVSLEARGETNAIKEREAHVKSSTNSGSKRR